MTAPASPQAVKIECRTCGRRNNHAVEAEIAERGSDEVARDYTIEWEATYQIVKCQGCDSVSFRRTTWNSEDDYVQVGPEEWEKIIQEDIFPNPDAGREQISDWHLLPDQVYRIYEESIRALNANQRILCGIGVRALVEAICKERNASGRDLASKIDDLVKQGVLTPDGADILHKIRTLGNNAAHEVKPHSVQQLGLALDVAEHLLSGVYILPVHAKRTFK